MSSGGNGSVNNFALKKSTNYEYGLFPEVANDQNNMTFRCQVASAPTRSNVFNLPRAKSFLSSTTITRHQNENVDGSKFSLYESVGYINFPAHLTNLVVVKKRFLANKNDNVGQLYEGKVVEYDAFENYNMVQYSDSDQEELETFQLPMYANSKGERNGKQGQFFLYGSNSTIRQGKIIATRVKNNVVVYDIDIAGRQLKVTNAVAEDIVKIKEYLQLKKNKKKAKE